MKKTFLLALTAIFSFGLFLTLGQHEKLSAQTSNVVITSNVQTHNLPVELVLGQNLPTYEYEGVETIDFRRYFSITVDRQPVLDMWVLDTETGERGIDKGGYEWNFAAFDINRLGQSPVFIVYGEHSLRINFVVIAEDITPPHLFVYQDGIPVVTALPQQFQIEAGRNLAQQFINYFVGDNIDDETQLVKRDENGDYIFKEEYFPNYEILDDAVANVEYELEIRVYDSAGNLYEQDIVVIIRDTTPPTIFNIPNIEIKKGNRVDYKENIVVQDNLSVPENIELTYDIVDKDNLNEVIGSESDIDGLFDILGEHNIRVRAVDENGNTSTRIIRLVVKNPVSIGELILYVNLIGLGIFGVGFGIYYLTNKSKNKKGENNE